MSYDAVNNVLSVTWAGKNFDNLGNVTITYGIIGIGDCGDLNMTVEGTRWEENSDTIGHVTTLCRQYVIVFFSFKCFKTDRYSESRYLFFLSHIRVVERSGSLSVQGLKPYRRYNVKAVIEVFNLTSTENDRTISQNITTQDESQYL